MKTRKIDPNFLRDLQRLQYPKIRYIEDTCPALAAGGSSIKTVNIGAEGDFLLERITAEYTTLVQPAASPVDDGANHLRVQLKDTTNGVLLFDNFIPISLFAAPGRTRTMGVDVDSTGAGVKPGSSEALHIPGFPFEYLFKANSEISIESRNDSTYANSYRIGFVGTQLKDQRRITAAQQTH